STEYRISSTYDALNRVQSVQFPQDVEEARKTLRPSYNRAGALEQVSLDEVPYVRRIAYNAKGQRTLIAYGNNVMTRYAYHPQSFRLARLRSDRYTWPQSDPHTYTPSNLALPLQDLVYDCDLVGNVLFIADRTPGCGVKDNPKAGEDPARVPPELAIK